ncbi:MAG: 6-phosphofructokinase [Ruminococcus sp.]|uniref:6-phosphofructokinase n=1 Tax=unclassified Ruminococcus TaxID=2608920 RepID=UPI00164B41AA|nr:6-phosphofructokinase [uncultured Ruminococcus sp.]MBQ1353362.1 6-phosphofructokinase [Ruminococcus sp.]MDO4891741.1 6-phosphofructokinase [Eubacteriales bacterium]MBQ1587329.1 6-phosphofructokinase [Ruminococcus sp.]MBQ1717239.1 6-phosphofructokinase [Ruminococcus sp.]MBQ1829920.1 6-phosphofructokinase [Ruminococcus sp.]
MSQQKAIAVLTSGGDAPGMNAAFRAVVRTGINMGMKVYGVYRGFNGLLNQDVAEMNLRSVSEIIGYGGTKLYTARSEEFKTLEAQQRAAEFCRSLGICGVVVIGGDGSFRGARALTNAGINCIGVPGTIDNDIACSEYTVGFDTAMNTALQMVDRIRDTAQSHDRCSIVEVMGRRCGDIALQTGIATGATAILVPEVKYNIERDVITRIINTQKTGKKHFIVVVAEGVGGVRDLAKYIEQRLDIEARATILGHVQRGGSPTLRDRVVASQMGYKAVELLKNNIGNRVVVMRGGKITDLDINEALDMKRVFDTELYKIAMTISI